MFEVNLDSSVIISVLIRDKHYDDVIRTIPKLKTLRSQLYISLVVYSEIWTGIELIDDVGERNKSTKNFNKMLGSIQSKIVSDNVIIAQRAAKAQAEYKRKGGKRDILIPDFLIGANAEFYSGRILTTNPRDFMKYFPEVEVITPTILLERH